MLSNPVQVSGKSAEKKQSSATKTFWELRPGKPITPELAGQYDELTRVAIIEPNLKRVQALLSDGVLDVNHRFAKGDTVVPSITWYNIVRLDESSPQYEERRQIIKYFLVDKKANHYAWSSDRKMDNILHLAVLSCGPKTLEFLIKDCHVPVDSVRPVREDDSGKQMVHCSTPLALAIELLYAGYRSKDINVLKLLELGASLKTALPFLFPLIYDGSIKPILDMLTLHREVAPLVRDKMLKVIEELVITDGISDATIREIGQYLRSFFYKTKSDHLQELLGVSDTGAINCSDRSMVLRMKIAVINTIIRFFRFCPEVNKPSVTEEQKTEAEAKASASVKKQAMKIADLLTKCQGEIRVDELDALIEVLNSYNIDFLAMDVTELFDFMEISAKLTIASINYADLNDRDSILRIKNVFNKVGLIHQHLDAIRGRLSQYDGSIEIAALKRRFSLFMAASQEINANLAELDTTAEQSFIHDTDRDVIQKSCRDIQILSISSSFNLCAENMRTWRRTQTLEAATGCLRSAEAILDYLKTHGFERNAKYEDDDNYRIQEEIRSECSDYYYTIIEKQIPISQASHVKAQNGKESEEQHHRVESIFSAKIAKDAPDKTIKIFLEQNKLNEAGLEKRLRKTNYNDVVVKLYIYVIIAKDKSKSKRADNWKAANIIFDTLKNSWVLSTGDSDHLTINMHILMFKTMIADLATQAIICAKPTKKILQVVGKFEGHKTENVVSPPASMDEHKEAAAFVPTEKKQQSTTEQSCVVQEPKVKRIDETSEHYRQLKVAEHKNKVSSIVNTSEQKETKRLMLELKAAQLKQKTINDKLLAAQLTSTTSLQQSYDKFAKRKKTLLETQKSFVAEAELLAQTNTNTISQLSSELEEEVKQSGKLAQKKSSLESEIEQLTTKILQRQASKDNITKKTVELEETCKRNKREQLLETTKFETLQQQILLSDVRIKVAGIKTKQMGLKTAIAKVKTQIAQDSGSTDVVRRQTASLKQRHVQHEEIKSATTSKEQTLIRAQQANADHIKRQDAANTAHKQFLQAKEKQLQERQARLAAAHARLNLRAAALRALMQPAQVMQPPTTPVLPILSGSGYKSRMTYIQRQSPAHDQFSMILTALLTQYLPKYFKDVTVMVTGNFINDLIATEPGEARDKLILNPGNPKPILELPSCVIVPVDKLDEPDYEALKKMGIIMYQLSMSSEHRHLYHVTNHKEDVTFIIRQQLVNLSRAPQDVLRSTVDKAVFTKDRVILNMSQTNFMQSTAEIWYREEKDLQALQTGELVLVDDLQSKSPLLSFSMIADLLQLGDKAKIAEIKPLRTWTEELWNTVEDDLTLSKKHNALLPWLLDQSKLKALKVMHQCDILETMTLPDDPESRLSTDQFNAFYHKVSLLQRNYLRSIPKPQVRVKKDELKTASTAVDPIMLKKQYLSQVYGHLMYACYIKPSSAKLQEMQIVAMLDKLKALFANGSLNPEDVRKAILTAEGQLTTDASLSRTMGMFNPVVPAVSVIPATMPAPPL